jgi:transposase-like protein
MDNDTEADYRAKIILLRGEGYTVAEIRRQTNHNDNNIRKWIHRFNSHGIDGIVSRKHNHTAPKITDDIEKEIVRIASTNPRKLGLKFSRRKAASLSILSTRWIHYMVRVSNKYS